MPFATRFAPSPTGYLHRGHAFSALTAFEAAREVGGRFVLRIEDIDTIRCRPEFGAAIYDDLEWLGLEWEKLVRRQSEHLADYRGALDRLSFVEEGSGPGGEHGLIRARPETAGDVVLARKDVGVAYHLAVVFDDALQGITQVIRGQDLFEATHIQRLLQTLLGLPEPTYRHHRLLTGPDGKRFAKRDQAETLRELRARGVTPDALKAELAFSS